MNAERLLALFERISEAPDAIPRLRRFILDIAVRGKLVEQDPGDEPAEELLQRLKVAKTLAYELEGLRKRQPVNSVSRGDLWFDMPADWAIPCFDDLFVIVSGVTKGQKIPPSEAVEAPYLRVANVQRGSLDLSQIKTISVRAADAERYRLEDQDILMTEGGDWDKLGRAAIWADQIPGCIHQNHVFRLRMPTDDLLPEWVVMYANSDPGRKFFEDCSKQTTNLASINLTQLRSCPLPLPPLAEQHRIVAKVDELMALCDQLEAARQQREQCRERLVAASLQRLNQPSDEPEAFRSDARFALQVLPSLTSTPAQIKQLRQTILNLAVRGKLVEQDPEDEPVNCADNHLPEGLQEPWEIPASWQWITLASLGDVRGGGTPTKATPEFWEGPIPWVSPKDMKVDYLESAQMSISDAALHASAATLIESPAVLFVVRGMILAHSFPVAVTRVAVAVNQDMKALIPREPRFSEYLLRALKGLKPEMLKRVQRSTHGTCRIEREDYLYFPIPLPPLAEQHRIVAKVDELMTLCDQLEQQLSQAEQSRRELLEAVLREALEGRLPERPEERHAAIA